MRYYLFTLRWLWRHRYWMNSRQKFKAMERDWENTGYVIPRFKYLYREVGGTKR